MDTVAIQPLDIKLATVAEQVRAIHLSAYSQEAVLAGVKSLPPLERSASQIQSLPESFFGAFIGGVFAGCLSEAKGDDSQVEICSLAVLPGFQRLGIGRALLQHSVSRASGKPMLASTAAANRPAISLYESTGFLVFRRSTVPAMHLELVHLQRLGSNPSVNGTSCAYAQDAPYVERCNMM
jgi:ribosomal protein S18 acetylase RimI-like enzyme